MPDECTSGRNYTEQASPLGRGIAEGDGKGVYLCVKYPERSIQMIAKLLYTLKIERENDRMTVRAPNYWWLFVLFAAGMMGQGVYLLIDTILCFTGEAGDYIGICFLFVWMSVIAWMGLTVLRMARTVTVDKTGISDKPMLPVRKPMAYKWSEITDWGVTYAEENRNGGKKYTLYFSDHTMPAHPRTLSKRLKGKCIKLDFFENEYSLLFTEFMPFCKARAPIEPFDPIQSE